MVSEVIVNFFLAPHFFSLFFSFLFILISTALVYGSSNPRQSFNILSRITLACTFFSMLSCFYALFNFVTNVEGSQEIFEFFIEETGVLIVQCGIFLFSFICFFLSFNFFFEKKIINVETPFLFFSSMFGSILLVSSNHSLSFFLSIELQTLPLFALIALQRNSASAVEAALKYYLYSAVSSGLLLFAFSVIYFTSGFLVFEHLSLFLELARLKVFDFSKFSPFFNEDFLCEILFKGAILLIYLVLFFKLSLFPFQFWAPEVYSGATAPIIFYLSLIPKLSILYVLYFFNFHIFYSFGPFFNPLLIFVGLLSIAIGVLGAVSYQKISKILAFGSTSHFGYLCLFLGCLTPKNPLSLDFFLIFIFYAIFYAISLILFFIVWLRVDINGKPANFTSDFAILNQYDKSAAIFLSVAIFSMASLPPFAGFTAKLLIFEYLVFNQQYFYFIFAAFFGVASNIFYFRFIKAIFFSQNNNKSQIRSKSLTRFEIFLGSFLCLFLLFISLVFVS